MENTFTFNTVEQRDYKEFRRAKFLRYDVGAHTVRFLSQPKTFFTHYLRGIATVECLEENCPICENNRQLREQYGKDASKQPTFNSSSARHYVNALDRTLVKRCPQCDMLNYRNNTGRFSGQCTECGAFITEVVPEEAREVVVVNMSNSTNGVLAATAAQKMTSDGVPINLFDYDVSFLVTMSGKKKTITPSITDNNDSIEVDEEELYDLDNVVIRLTAEEITTLLTGVSLKDIFLARRGETFLETDANLEDVTEQVENLFTN